MIKWDNEYIWYDIHTKSWVVQRKLKGNQVGEADFVYTKQEALLLKEQYKTERLKKNPNSLYESFHGNPPKELRKVKLHVPKKGEHLVAIGKLAKIEYIPFGSSRRKNTQFYHVSGDTGEGVLPTNLILCCDQSGKNFYLVKEDDTKEFPRFSERGILG